MIMSVPESVSKVAAVCKNCQSLYVSELKSDGTIRPIGVSADCTCGNGEFRCVS